MQSLRLRPKDSIFMPGLKPALSRSNSDDFYKRDEEWKEPYVSKEEGKLAVKKCESPTAISDCSTDDAPGTGKKSGQS